MTKKAHNGLYCEGGLDNMEVKVEDGYGVYIPNHIKYSYAKTCWPLEFGRVEKLILPEEYLK